MAALTLEAKNIIDMTQEQRLKLVEEYYTLFEKDYYYDIHRFDGMYYPPLWVNTKKKKALCINHLPDNLVYEIIRYQRGRFGCFPHNFGDWVDINIVHEQNIECKVCKRTV